jgi:hypothetical protein
MSTRWFLTGGALLGLLALGLTAGLRPALAGAAGGGQVLPATATPGGNSLADMAAELADFSTSGNDLDYYPDTPFQILYVDPDRYDDASHSYVFTVPPGTQFFVPVANTDNAEPILGDFPAGAAGVPAYVFGAGQLGGHDLTIVVDGSATTLGPAYAAGAFGLDLPDGASAYLQIGAFLTPLSAGTHTVTIRGTFDGDAVLEAFGGPFTFEFTYTVNVRQ